nr:hypothetical protein Iba_chr11cCG7580 [Ipomoea batatas]
MRYRKLEQWGTHSMLLRAFPCWHFLRLFFRESGKDCSSISITAPGHRPECLANDSTILAGKFCLAKPNVEVARNDSDEQQNLKVCLQQRHCFLYVHPILAVHQVQLPTSHSSILHLNQKSLAFFLACLLRILVYRQFWKVMRLRFADQMLFGIVKGARCQEAKNSTSENSLNLNCKSWGWKKPEEFKGNREIKGKKIRIIRSVLFCFFLSAAFSLFLMLQGKPQGNNQNYHVQFLRYPESCDCKSNIRTSEIGSHSGPRRFTEAKPFKPHH